MNLTDINIEILEQDFSICKIKDLTKINLNDEFFFLGKTDEETSLVCYSSSVPENVKECENEWRAFRISGVLDFSLTGILAKLSTILADEQIGLFAVSTYNTDYILVKSFNLDKAIASLKNHGYGVL